MNYYFSKTLNRSFDEAVDKVTQSLKAEGFGVLTEIDVKSTMKNKLDVDFRNYKILGACNPPLAYEALQSERMIGAMLPCNVVVQETEDGRVEVAAVDPAASMQAVKNEKLAGTALQVQTKLKNVIDSL